MRFRNIVICIMLIMLLFAGVCTYADIADPGDDFYYLDEADVLSTQTEGEIYFCNKLLDEACGSQIVIAAVRNTGKYAIDDYAYELFNKWEIGDKKENNGFLLLMSIEDEDYYAMAGSGMDVRFSSGTIGNYLDKYLEPYFAKADYNEGAKIFFEAVFQRIADMYGVDVTVQDGISAYNQYVNVSESDASDVQHNGYIERDSRGNGNLILVVIGLVILLSIVSKRQKRHQRYSATSRNSFLIPFLLGRMTASNRRNYTNSAFRHNMHFGNDMFRTPNSGRSHFSHRSGGFSGTGFSSGRSSGFGTGRSSGFSSGRSGGFGGARPGGGGSRGGGAGRGRR